MVKVTYRIETIASGKFRVIKSNRFIGIFPTREEAMKFIKIVNAMDEAYISSPFLDKKRKRELIFGK